MLFKIFVTVSVFFSLTAWAQSQEIPKVQAIQQSQINTINSDLETLAGKSKGNTVLQQVQAQATCTALKPSQWVFAVYRTDGRQTCSQICDKLVEEQAGRLKCFNALHIYAANNPSNQGQVLGLKTFRYNSCSNLDFGPNFCCCGD